TINPAVPTISVTGGTFTYDGQPHAAAGAVVGVNGTDLGTPTIFYIDNESISRRPPVHGGTYMVSAFFAGSAGYVPTATRATITITPATPTSNVTGGTFTYDGQPHPATGSVAGVNGADLGTPVFSYTDASGNTSSSPPVNVGMYTVTASFAGSAD